MPASLRLVAALVIGLLGPTAATAADRTVDVLMVGTFHLSNPGRDLNNVEADDVMKPQRQRELQAITDALRRFDPTVVAVEWPAETVDERYPQYLDGTLAPSRNEVVQLGFRLAKDAGLQRVYGLDMDGEFPFEAVQDFAKAHGRAGEIDALMAMGAAETKKIGDLQRDHTLGGVLRTMNTDAAYRTNHSFYTSILTMGDGDAQPGADLVAAWTKRNLRICARLLQVVKPGDRVVAFYGQGHLYLLRQCLRDAPNVRWVDPLRYLPR